MENPVTGKIEKSLVFEGRIPKQLIVIVVAICVLPYLLNQLGIDFGTRGTVLDPAQLVHADKLRIIESAFSSLKGAFTHTLLEWSAFSIAVLVMFLAFSLYRITGEVTAPIIGMAFFMAGCMDAFHILAADRLISAVADNQDLIPFTWAVSRTFNALIMIAGVGILLSRGHHAKVKPGIWLVLSASLVFAVIAYGIIHISATSTQLPQTAFPNAHITRPYDALPLLLFVFSGLVVYPRLFKRYPSLFAQALIISAVPQVVAQLHMTFGSAALFDNHFNIAHFMKLIAYLVPLTGLTLEFIRVYRQSMFMHGKLIDSSAALMESEQRTRTIMNNVADSIITIDAKGIIQSSNQATSELFGYAENALLGRNINMLMPEPYRSQHNSHLEHYLETAKTKVIGSRREVTGLRSDGSTFPMDLFVSEITVDNQKIYTGIIRDITERIAAEKAKTEFISTVSHELRTPLTSIRGALGLVLGGASGDLPDQARKMLLVANRNSERLILLINDLLDLEKIEAGKLEFEYQVLDLVQLVHKALEANQAYAAEHDVRLEFTPGLAAIMVNGDDHRLQQVLSNLISNAVKFSPQPGVVEVSVTRNSDGRARTTVRDYGPGISEVFKSRMFQRFAQADSSDARKKGGTGLGLSISKAIIEGHGGQIDFRAAPGGGTEFYFDLVEILTAGETLAAGGGAKEAHGEAASETEVLICEDDADVAHVLESLLKQEGLECDIAASAAAAKALLNRHSYMLLLLDLELPDQDGLEMIQELKADHKTAGLPIIVVSASAHEGRAALSGTGLEVVDWIQKPIDADRLMNSLHQVLGSKECPRVLHVEDDADVLETVRELLKDMATYDFAPNLDSARAKFEKNAYDLVILDIKLPDGSGLELLPEIQAKCPAIIFAGEEPDRAIRLEVAAYLTKATTSNEQLLATIRRVINRANRNMRVSTNT